MEEHEQILRLCRVIRSRCCAALEGGEIDVQEGRAVVDFIQNYADALHHKKEENCLYKLMVERLGRVAENLVTHGMLVDHHEARNTVRELLAALDRYEQEPGTATKLDVIGRAMGYVYLLEAHVSRENEVVYPFANRMLSAEDQQRVDEDSLQIQKEHQKEIEHYLHFLEELEAE